VGFRLPLSSFFLIRCVFLAELFFEQPLRFPIVRRSSTIPRNADLFRARLRETAPLLGHFARVPSRSSGSPPRFAHFVFRGTEFSQSANGLSLRLMRSSVVSGRARRASGRGDRQADAGAAVIHR